MDPKDAAKVLATAMQGETSQDHLFGRPNVSQAIRRNGGDREFRQTLVHVLMDIADSWDALPHQTAAEVEGNLNL